MTRRSRLYFNRKWFEKHSVKIPFEYEPSLMNDLVMFGRACNRTYIDENGMPKAEYIPLTSEQVRFFNTFKSIR